MDWDKMWFIRDGARKVDAKTAIENISSGDTIVRFYRFGLDQEVVEFRLSAAELHIKYYFCSQLDRVDGPAEILLAVEQTQVLSQLENLDDPKNISSLGTEIYTSWYVGGLPLIGFNEYNKTEKGLVTYMQLRPRLRPFVLTICSVNSWLRPELIEKLSLLETI